MLKRRIPAKLNPAQRPLINNHNNARIHRKGQLLPPQQTYQCDTGREQTQRYKEIPMNPILRNMFLLITLYRISGSGTWYSRLFVVIIRPNPIARTMALDRNACTSC